MDERHAGLPVGAVAHTVRIKAGDPRVVLFLGRLYGHLEHWKGSHFTYPCGGTDCSSCKRGDRIYFYAYASSQVLNLLTKRWIPSVIQVTASCEEELRGLNLRGTVWELTRLPNKDKVGRLIPRHLEDRDPTTIPPEFDIRPSLAKLFGSRDLNLTAVNPYTSLEIQEAYSGPLPAGFEDKPLPVTQPPSKPLLKQFEELQINQEARKSRANHERNGK